MSEPTPSVMDATATSTAPNTADGRAATTSTTPPNADGAIPLQQIEQFRAKFNTERTNRIAQNAVTQAPIDDVALNRELVTTTHHTFSIKLDDWQVTDQKKSGRCWMFAALNLFRAGAMKKMNLKEFEFSQNYTLFWDKFERANYFLEAIIQTADRPVDDRTVGFMLDRPLEDGGQWNMFVNVVKKHGVAPKAAMPETESSSNTGRMNQNVINLLRQSARDLRQLRANGAPMEAARAAKTEIMQQVYRVLCIHLGTPPTKFDWQWTDNDNKFHRDGTLTPQQFAEKYITIPLDDYVCIVNDPRETSPYNKTYTVDKLGNVVGGEIVKYLNVENDVMKDIARRTLESGEPVWFGCDVGKMMRRDMGLWDAELFDYDDLYNVEYNMSKRDRLVYHQTLMTHAMLFTGVDLVDGKPRRWRVENSWGEENGQKGFYTMNDSWFDQYMFEIAARKEFLPDELKQALELEPIVLPAWDPMGALA